MRFSGRAVGAILVAAALVSGCGAKQGSDSSTGADPWADPAVEFTTSPRPDVPRDVLVRLPDPCSIQHNVVVGAHLKRDWRGPVGREIRPRPDVKIIATQCRYRDEANPGLRVVVEFRSQSAGDLVALYNPATFDESELQGRKMYLRPTSGTKSCGMIVDFKFGMMVVLIVSDKPDVQCDRTVEVAEALIPWFAQWED